jgi:hypothetical protein
LNHQTNNIGKPPAGYVQLGMYLEADAELDDGRRFVVRADEKLTAFLELESAIRGFSLVFAHARTE